MWSTLALLLLFGAVIGIGAVPTCTVYELPSAADGSCEITINYMARDDKQALATCLEYFPTTFVKGEKTNEGKTKCIVTAAYQCVEPDTFLIFDKCYKFPKDSAGEYVTGTIKQYVDEKKCGNGKLSVFYSHTHAKFVGMKAHRENIFKLWIGITKDGKMIEEPHTMIHSKMWKLVENDYWDGDELTKIPPKGPDDEEQKIPDEAMYYFMRTRTDYVMNRIQGHFERASAAVEATFACEFPSVYTEHQAWYCNKLPALGIDAVYDDMNKPHRCLYVSANEYTFRGDNKDAAFADMANIKGCQERPSALHSSGMDDGTARPEKYISGLKYQGKMRIAGYYAKSIVGANPHFTPYVQSKCSGSTPSGNDRSQAYAQWRFLNHHGTMQLPASSRINWDSNYPLNECSDFPGQSTTLGVLKGRFVDMPPEVRARAVCSLVFFQECENRRNPCGNKLECTNQITYQAPVAFPKFHGFFTCNCPGQLITTIKGTKPYTDDTDSAGEKTCKWADGKDDQCAWLHFYPHNDAGLEKFISKGFDDNFFDTTLFNSGNTGRFNDHLTRAVVRDGCHLTIRAAGKGWTWNAELVDGVGYGTHNVPNSHDGSLGADWHGQGASSGVCWCNS